MGRWFLKSSIDYFLKGNLLLLILVSILIFTGCFGVFLKKDMYKQILGAYMDSMMDFSIEQ